jgi:hypothetical protein
VEDDASVVFEEPVVVELEPRASGSAHASAKDPALGE